MRTAGAVEGGAPASGGEQSAGGSGVEPAVQGKPARQVVAADGAADVRELVERSPLAMAVADAGTHEVRYANAAFASLRPAREDLPASRVIVHLLPEPLARVVAEVLDHVRRTGEARADVDACGDPDSDGARCWQVTAWPACACSCQPRDVVIQLHDVSDQVSTKRAMAEMMDQLRDINGRLLMASLRESELAARAEAASDAKSTFLSVMSHELRTPLTAIIGYEELLADGIIGPVSATQRAHLARIKTSADHLLALIDQVLTLARIDAHREVIQWEAVDLHVLIDWATTIVTPLLAAKGLLFELEVSDDPLFIRTDPLKVRQVLINLLGNAVKFTDRGGVRLIVQVDGSSCRFRVSDTGIGIAPLDLDRIFGEFWQVEQKPTRRAGGSGLGLSVSMRLARLLGGTIEVESVVGEGTTFTFMLPLDAQPSARVA